MSLFPISLGVRRQPATGETASSVSRPRSQSQNDKILKRDDYTCRCCGFKSRRYQRVVASDIFPKANDEFVTLCLFCELCFSLERTASGASGLLIWLPEIGQADLHHIMRAIYVARSGENDLLAEAATKAYDALVARRAEAKKRLGSDDPSLLATAFHEGLNDKEYAGRGAKLEGIRFLPMDRVMVRTRHGDSNQFPQILKYWRSGEGPFGRYSLNDWTKLFDSVLLKAAV